TLMDELAGRLAELFGEPVEVERTAMLAGGASKESWAVDAGGRELLVRRAGGGVIHLDTLSLRDEFEVLLAARRAGVKAPEPLGYLGEVDGREAFVMERVHGETIGRRIVKEPPRSLPLQMAEELAKIHTIPRDDLPFLPDADLFERLYAELDTVDEPHPAIELGLAWCQERLPLERTRVVTHGDFRIGNLVIDANGLVAVLDWEFAHVSDPAEDLAWPLVRAWRFGEDGRRLGGIGDVEPYLDRYAELTGREIPLDELYAWEVLGNCKWAIGALTQARRHLRGEERSVELAILGRLAAEMEYELLDLIESAPSRPRPAVAPAESSPAPPPRPAHRTAPSGIVLPAPSPSALQREGAAGASGSDRPTAGELAAAVREFLEMEILPTLDDHRLRFRTLVAMNALSIVERESPRPAAPDEADAELARRIRAGEARADDLVLIRHKVRERLLLASPRYLERYR
ncbi:MAG TPA: phosphotransferase, partial [Gaiellaceae bacterium]|nr:phosphotransferase [Gaiellaceae bacterium]